MAAAITRSRLQEYAHQPVYGDHEFPLRVKNPLFKVCEDFEEALSPAIFYQVPASLVTDLAETALRYAHNPDILPQWLEDDQIEDFIMGRGVRCSLMRFHDFLAEVEAEDQSNG